jgi:hypothetical protein
MNSVSRVRWRAVARADAAATGREIGEDRRELREDRRETRDDRRERREP